MADLIIGSSNIISTDSGTPTIQGGVSFPAGHILQVKHGFFNGMTSGSSTTPAQITNLSVSITPNHASNKIIISVNVSIIPQTNSHCGILLYKNGSEITGATNSNSDSSSNRVHYFLTTGYHSAVGTLTHQRLMIDRLSGSYEDTAGSTNSTTYAVYARAREGSHEYYINRSQNDSAQGDDNGVARGTSSITVMEIVG